MTAARMREKFDPSFDFFAAKTFTFSGKAVEAGQPFDKSVVELRRLRQLYDTRFLRQQAPIDAVEQKVKEKPIVEFGRTFEERKPAPQEESAEEEVEDVKAAAPTPEKKAKKISAAKKKAKKARGE